jgi:hypothetical protein
MARSSKPITSNSDDKSKRTRYDLFKSDANHDVVVNTIRVYLGAAVANPRATQQKYWAMSCLPIYQGGIYRYSTISMRGMETFCVYLPYFSEEEEVGEVNAFVMVAGSILGRNRAAVSRFAQSAALTIDPRTYVDGGDDQVALVGTVQNLNEALTQTALGPAARTIAEHLMERTTRHARHHNPYLAGRVLG